jgi:hypothetical protein
MTERRGNWLWNLLRRKSRRELDRIEADLIKRPAEKRQYAGDPQGDRRLWVRTRNKP